MNEKIISLLGFAAKAGKLSYGTHATEWAIERGKACLVCAANDISQKSLKEFRFKAEKQEIPVILLNQTDSQTLSKAIGKSCKVIAVNDGSFAKAITERYAQNKADLGGTAHDGEI